MSKNSDRVKDLAVPASSVKHSGKIAYSFPSSERKELRKSLEPKLKQNQRERTASEEEARNVIVK